MSQWLLSDKWRCWSTARRIDPWFAKHCALFRRGIQDSCHVRHHNDTRGRLVRKIRSGKAVAERRGPAQSTPFPRGLAPGCVSTPHGHPAGDRADHEADHEADDQASRQAPGHRHRARDQEGRQGGDAVTP